MLHGSGRHTATGRLGRSWITQSKPGAHRSRRPSGSNNSSTLAVHPDEASLFDLFMQHSPDDRHAAVVEAYDFSSAGLVVDVGGGNGALLAGILTAYPDVSGLLFDQEGASSPLPRTRYRIGLSGRCQIEAGNFLEAVPNGGDIYTLSRILFPARLDCMSAA